jgi:hypothetical protein
LLLLMSSEGGVGVAMAEVALLELARPGCVARVGWAGGSSPEAQAGQSALDSLAQVVNAKMLLLAVKKTSKRLFVCFSAGEDAPDAVEDQVLRQQMPFLYNELWDLALDNNKTDLDCIVLPCSALAFFQGDAQASGADTVQVIWSA